MNDPTKLDYKYLEPGAGPKYGVSDSQSENFRTGSRQVFAWFCTSEHAIQFSEGRMVKIWDLEEGRLI